MLLRSINSWIIVKPKILITMANKVQKLHKFIHQPRTGNKNLAMEQTPFFISNKSRSNDHRKDQIDRRMKYNDNKKKLDEYDFCQRGLQKSSWYEKCAETIENFTNYK